MHNTACSTLKNQKFPHVSKEKEPSHTIKLRIHSIPQRK